MTEKDPFGKDLTDEPYVCDRNGLCADYYCLNEHDGLHYFAGCGNIWVVCQSHHDLQDDHEYQDWLARMERKR